MAFTATGLELLGFSNRYPGAFAERMQLTAAMCLPVPNGLDARTASLTEPVAVAVHAVNKSVDAARRRRARARRRTDRARDHRGAEGAWRRPDRRERLLAAPARPRDGDGRDVGGRPRRRDRDGRLDRAAGGATPVVFEAIGVPGILDDICRAVPSQTRITVVGVCMETDSFLPLVAIAKELQFQFVIYYDPSEFADTLRQLAEGEIDPRPLLTGRVGIDGVPDAFTTLGHPETHAKVVVEPDAGAAITPI